MSQPPGGSSNLWDLVSVINGQDDSLLPASYGKGVMHMKHLLKFKTVHTVGLNQVRCRHNECVRRLWRSSANQVTDWMGPQECSPSGEMWIRWMCPSLSINSSRCKYENNIISLLVLLPSSMTLSLYRNSQNCLIYLCHLLNNCYHSLHSYFFQFIPCFLSLKPKSSL